eukprot:scaffold405517_cov24-Prasinocladus_malaysianus.AAC.1
MAYNTVRCIAVRLPAYIVIGGVDNIGKQSTLRRWLVCHHKVTTAFADSQENEHLRISDRL